MSPDVEDLKNMHIEKPANVEYLRARIAALEAPHTDRYTPCPKCGHVITHVERKPIVVVDEGGEDE